MSQTILAKCQRFIDALAHMRKLNLRVIQADQKRVVIVLPVQSMLLCPEGVDYTHGGVLTTLVDTACSLSTLTVLAEYELCPTLDLRIDHMSTAALSRPLYAQAQCYRVTRNVLFTRASVYQDDPQRPVAHALATFMRPEPGNTDTDFKAYVDGIR